MPVNPPLPQDTRSRLADWLEVEVLVRPRGVAAKGDVLRLYDFMEDDGHELEIDDVTGEELETEILEDDRAQRADEVLAEIDHRSQTLGVDYPFAIEATRMQWRISAASASDDDRIKAARACYLFCLLISAIRDNRINGSTVAALRHSMANHFQAIATAAAAGILNGQAISFGSPRPSGLGFRPALADASEQMRLGKPLDSVPLWSNGQEKDAGIDVIAWRDFRDGRPAKLVMLGQVASGNDWGEKSVKNDVYRFFDWFSKRPTEHYVPSIFIPFPQHHECLGRQDAAFEEVAFESAWHLERGFGVIVDRLRIVEAAAAQLAAPHDGTGGSTLGTMEAWMADALNLARQPI